MGKGITGQRVQLEVRKGRECGEKRGGVGGWRVGVQGEMWGWGECYDVKRACSSKPGEERGRLRRGLRLTFYSEAQGNVLNFCSGWHVRFSRGPQ